jgi:plasmid maintenance system antidote protein VapI
MIDSKKLKAAMVRAGYTQPLLADVMNLSVNTINAKVNGRAKMTTDEAQALIEILSINDDCEKIEIFLA